MHREIAHGKSDTPNVPRHSRCTRCHKKNQNKVLPSRSAWIARTASTVLLWALFKAIAFWVWTQDTSQPGRSQCEAEYLGLEGPLGVLGIRELFLHGRHHVAMLPVNLSSLIGLKFQLLPEELLLLRLLLPLLCHSAPLEPQSPHIILHMAATESPKDCGMWTLSHVLQPYLSVRSCYGLQGLSIQPVILRFGA